MNQKLGGFLVEAFFTVELLDSRCFLLVLVVPVKLLFLLQLKVLVGPKFTRCYQKTPKKYDSWKEVDIRAIQFIWEEGHMGGVKRFDYLIPMIHFEQYVRLKWVKKTPPR